MSCSGTGLVSPQRADTVVSGSAVETGVVAQILAGGEALVHYSGGTVLLAGGLPGETVRFQTEAKHRGAARGRLLAVESSSPHRIAASCPIADPAGDLVCGGCAIQNLSPSEHQQTKLQWVTDHFAPLINDSVTVGWLPGAPPAGGWQRRRRVRWHVAQHDGGIVVGFRPKRSHQVLSANDCRVVVPTLATLRLSLAQVMQSGELPLLSAITATVLSDGIHLLLEGSFVEGQAPPFLEVDGLPLQWWWQQENGITPWNRPVHRLHDLLPAVDGGDVAVEVGAADFVQADSDANGALMRWLIAQTGSSRRVVDLFCGVGNFSLPLADAGCSVVGADSNAHAIACANRSVRRLGVEASYHAIDLFHPFDAEPFTGADLLLLDPPRKGARRVVGMMGRLLPRQVIMMHCDPASGGRDGQQMVQQGYGLKTLYALDMFAWSGHVETISVWQQEACSSY